MTNKFPRKKRLLVLLTASIVWTFVFFSFALFSAFRARDQEAELIKKIQQSLLMQFEIKNIPFTSWIWEQAHYEEGEAEWGFDPGVDTLRIQVVSADIEIVSTPDAQKLHIKAHGYTNQMKIEEVFKVIRNKRRLVVEQSTRDSVRNLSLEVQIPAKILKRLLVETVSGAVNIRQAEVQELEIKSVSGALNLDGLRSQKLKLKSVSGDINIEKSDGYETAIETVSGDVHVKVDPLKTERKFFISSQTGEIQNPFQSVISSQFVLHIESLSGDIEIE